MLHQSLARLGEIGVFAKPLEKRNSKPLLELMHLAAAVKLPRSATSMNALS